MITESALTCSSGGIFAIRHKISSGVKYSVTVEILLNGYWVRVSRGGYSANIHGSVLPLMPIAQVLVGATAVDSFLLDVAATSRTTLGLSARGEILLRLASVELRC